MNGPRDLEGLHELPVVCVIPTYREPTSRIVRTIESAIAVERFTHILLVDDGSEGFDVLSFSQLTTRDVSVRAITLPRNMGPAAAMNAGVQLLPECAIVARLDVGDFFLPAPKQAQLEQVIAGVRASFSPHYDAVERREFLPPPTWHQRIYKDGVFCICTAVFERRAWVEVGGFDESLRYGDDWDFTMRVQHRIGWSMVPGVTCEAGAFPDGHTKRADRNPELRARKTADTQRVIELGLRLSHPGSLPPPRPIRRRGRR